MREPLPSLLKTRVGTAVTAVIGLMMAALSLLAFVLDLLVTPEIGALIFSFIVCGAGLTTGLIMLRRLAPRREPMSLFAESGGGPIEHSAHTESPPQAAEFSTHEIKTVSPIANGGEVLPVDCDDRRESVSRYKTAEGGGLVAVVVVIGMTIILLRVDFARVFLAFALPVGAGIALVLYWMSDRRRDSGSPGHAAPLAGGVIGFLCMAGLSIVMIRSHLMRDFFGLALGGGGVVALGLYWLRRRRENSSNSVV